MESNQHEFELWEKRGDDVVLGDVRRLIAMHMRGELGGAFMPEDSNPGYPRGCDRNYHYFTLPMSLNYQRNSYKLWEAAKKTAEDGETLFVFDPGTVAARPVEDLRTALLKHKVALQPVRHVATWHKICRTISGMLSGTIKNLFVQCDSDVPKLLEFVRQANKSSFPCLSGEKICHYWLYVMDQYTDAGLTGRSALTVAPDTHVIQASIRLGLVAPSGTVQNDSRRLVGEAWHRVLSGTGIDPIDIHTPLWLWSRGGFKVIS